MRIIDILQAGITRVEIAKLKVETGLLEIQNHLKARENEIASQKLDKKVQAILEEDIRRRNVDPSAVVVHAHSEKIQTAARSVEQLLNSKLSESDAVEFLTRLSTFSETEKSALLQAVIPQIRDK